MEKEVARVMAARAVVAKEESLERAVNTARMPRKGKKVEKVPREVITTTSVKTTTTSLAMTTGGSPMMVSVTHRRIFSVLSSK